MTALLSALEAPLAGHSLALAQQLGAEQVEVKVGRVSAEGHLDLRGDAFDTAEGERRGGDDEDGLPAQHVDEHEGEAQKVNRDTLLEVRGEDVRQGGLAGVSTGVGRQKRLTYCR